MSWFLIGILVFICLLILWVVGIYNRLVTLRNQVKNAWSQIDVQLQRRYDLIPNLVESVKGYMGHEKGTLEAVTRARNMAATARSNLQQQGGPTAGSIKELVAAEGSLAVTLGRFFAVAESYPQLRASENMMQLQEELTSTENKVAFSRQSYNDQVLAYNNAQQVFPTTLMASTFGHHPVEMYVAEKAEAKTAPQIKF